MAWKLICKGSEWGTTKSNELLTLHGKDLRLGSQEVVFSGVLFSIGSSSIVSNVISGILLTYTRAFRMSPTSYMPTLRSLLYR